MRRMSDAYCSVIKSFQNVDRDNLNLQFVT